MTPEDVREMHQKGLSYGRMSEAINIAKSTLAAWGKGRKLTTEAREIRYSVIKRDETNLGDKTCTGLGAQGSGDSHRTQARGPNLT